MGIKEIPSEFIVVEKDLNQGVKHNIKKTVSKDVLQKFLCYCCYGKRDILYNDMEIGSIEDAKNDNR